MDASAASSLAAKAPSERALEYTTLCVMDADQLRAMRRARESHERFLRKRRRSSLQRVPERRRRVAADEARRELSLSHLTDDNLLEIFLHLEQFPDLLNARQVCRRWRRVASDARLWRDVEFTDKNLDAFFRYTPALQSLRRLSLERVHGVSEAFVRAIPRQASCATIQAVNLTWCSGASDKSVVEFSRCPRLRELRLSHCRHVSRRSLKILAVRCPRLEVLELACISGVRDSLLATFGENCPYLRELNVANAKHVTDDGVAAIAKGCRRMQKLDLSWCIKVSDWAVLKIARGMPDLRKIALAETCVTDSSVIELLKKCPHLHDINIARCGDVSDEAAKFLLENAVSRITNLNIASCHNISDELVISIMTQAPKLVSLDVSKLPCRQIEHALQESQAVVNRVLEVYF